MNASVNELLSNPAFRPLVLLDVLAVFLMIICLVFRRMRKGYYVEQANDARAHGAEAGNGDPKRCGGGGQAVLHQ